MLATAVSTMPAVRLKKKWSPSAASQPRSMNTTSRTICTSWLACSTGRVPMRPNPANMYASQCQRFGKPSRITYMGPPRSVPALSRPRYITASVQVKNLVAMPTMAVIHIQKMAPGPPMTMASATPAMLPIPMVPASADDSAWKWVISPGSSGESYLPRSSAMACGMWRNGAKRVYTRKKKPPPNSSTSNHGPHAYAANARAKFWN